jgi:hypothetical protein
MSENGQVNNDKTPDTQSEFEPRKLTFREFAEKLSEKYPRVPSKEKDLYPAITTFIATSEDPRHKGNPALVVGFDPPLLIGRPPGVAVKIYHVNDSGVGEIRSDYNGPQFEELIVAGPPSPEEEQDEVERSENFLKQLQVARDQEEANKLSSWVVDPQVRELINKAAKFQK